MNILFRRPLFGRPFLKRGIEEFFDQATKPGEVPYAGRAWQPRELRLKSLGDLHKLWYILLKERNKLLTEKAQLPVGKELPNGTRIYKVRDSMRGIKIVIGERMRLNKFEDKLARTKDPKEMEELTKKIGELRVLTGTPNMRLPKEEIPYEERTMQVPRPAVDKSWWLVKAAKQKAEKEERRKNRADPEYFAKEQAHFAELNKKEAIRKAKATSSNKFNKLRNRAKKRQRKLASARTPIIQKTIRQKRVKKLGAKSFTEGYGKK